MMRGEAVETLARGAERIAAHAARLQAEAARAWRRLSVWLALRVVVSAGVWCIGWPAWPAAVLLGMSCADLAYCFLRDKRARDARACAAQAAEAVAHLRELLRLMGEKF